MKLLLVVGCLVGATSVIGFLWWNKEPQTAQVIVTPEPTPSEAEQLLRAQVDALASDVRQLKERRLSEVALPQLAAAAPAEALRAAANVPAPAAQPETDPEAQAQLADEKIQQQFEALERGLVHEPLDANWSKAAEGTLLTTYQSADFVGAKVQATCRSTYCQVKFDIGATERPDNASRLLSSRAPWQTASMMRFDTKTNLGELYMAREGHDLPLPN
jgi:hypothetical protein